MQVALILSLLGLPLLPSAHLIAWKFQLPGWSAGKNNNRLVWFKIPSGSSGRSEAYDKEQSTGDLTSRLYKLSICWTEEAAFSTTPFGSPSPSATKKSWKDEDGGTIVRNWPDTYWTSFQHPLCRDRSSYTTYFEHIHILLQHRWVGCSKTSSWSSIQKHTEQAILRQIFQI